MKYKLILFLFICLLGSVCFAQTRVVSGTVLDENGETIPFANVNVVGTIIGTTTDINGKYSITAPSDVSAALKYSFIGFMPQEVPIEARTTIDITLFPSVESLDELVVVGYGSSTKKELTGATTKVLGDKIERINIPRIDQALQGQVSGVSINTNSGSPGGSSSIRIRGLSTFGDNDPLILVDGIVYDSEGLNALNPADIESINVLKDATAGIYGVRAANGVIIIETKKGVKNSKPILSVDYYYGLQQPANKLNLLNATEYAVIKNEMFANGGESIAFNNTQIGEGTNWQDTIFQNAPMQNININLTGGSKTSKYSIGGSFFTQDGIVGGPKANFSRYNARINFSTDMTDKLTLNNVMLFTHEERSTLPENGIGSVLYNTINAFPNAPVKTGDGNYSYMEEVSDIINPVAQIENTFNGSMVDKVVGKEEFVYKINNNFTLTNRISYNYALVDVKSFSPLAWFGAGKAQNSAINANLDPSLVEIGDSVFIERGAGVYEARTSYLDLNYEGFFNYEQAIDENQTIKATLGTSVFKRRGENLSGSAFNIPNNSVEYADISANLAPGGFLNNTGSYEFEERLFSTFLRAEYNYKYRYLFSAIIRRDGSSKFGPSSKYGFFPTASAAWVLSDEGFFNFTPITFAKIRASYGVSGNDQISNFAYRALLNGEGVYVFNDVIVNGVAIGRSSNPDLKWETTRQLNVGADLNLYGSFDITVNYFIKNTFDLLFQPDVSALIGSYGPGGSPPIINAGDVSNQGLEVELSYNSDPKKPFVFGTNFNFTALKNIVKSTPEGVDFLPGASFSVGGNVATRFEEGFAIGYFHGYETNGVFQSQAAIDAAEVTQEGAKPGDLVFVDQDGDGIINFNDNSDKTDIGSPIPDFTIGTVLNSSYREFDLSINLYAAIGQEIIRNYERQQPYANQLDYVINRWVGEGTSTENPMVTTGATRSNEFSDFFVEDGSFLRIKNIQLGFTVPKKISKKFKVQSVRVYLASNNLYTLTRYQGFDPDIGSNGNALSAGVDYGFYPQARNFMAGINLKF